MEHDTSQIINVVFTQMFQIMNLSPQFYIFSPYTTVILDRAIKNPIS